MLNTTQYMMRRTWWTVHSTHYTAHTTHCTLHTTKYTLHSEVLPGHIEQWKLTPLLLNDYFPFPPNPSLNRCWIYSSPPNIQVDITFSWDITSIIIQEHKCLLIKFTHYYLYLQKHLSSLSRNKTQETLVERPSDCVHDNFGPLFWTSIESFEPICTY